MLRLTKARRAALAQTFRELANLAAGAMVLGQFVGERSFSPAVLLIGIAMWAALVGLALVFTGEG